MVKLVNITSKVAIRTVTPKICGTHKNILMSTGDIMRCICMRAHVEEVLPDGTTVVLNSANYNKNNFNNITDNIDGECPSVDSINMEPTDDMVHTCDDIEDDAEIANKENILEASPNHNKQHSGKKNKKHKNNMIDNFV
jgi:hypothetical protein